MTTNTVRDFVAKYAKFLVALLTAVGATTIAALLTEAGSIEMWVTAIVTLVTAASVYAFPDGIKSWQSGLKGLVALIGAVGTTTIVSMAQGAITTESLVIAVIAFLGALSTWSTPNVAHGQQLISVPVGEQVVTIKDGEAVELRRSTKRVDPTVKANPYLQLAVDPDRSPDLY